MFARHFIDSLEFASQGKELHGEIPVAELPRLADMAATTDGKFNYGLRGYLDPQGNPMLELKIAGQCQLRCQRCLQSMEYPVKIVSQFMLTDEETTDDLLEDEYDRIPASNHLDVAELIEEEILLNLPFAPKHEFGVCQADATGSSQDAGNPFRILRDLQAK